MKRRIERGIIHIALIGEIEGGLGSGQEIDETITPIGHLTTQDSVELTQSLASLRFCLRIDEICRTLDGGQVHPTVLHGTSAERTRFGDMASGMSSKRGHDSGAHREATMEVEFGHIFAGERRRSRHPRHEGGIEWFAGRGFAESPKR